MVCLSIHDGVTYNCTEQYMMAEKAQLFGDKDSEDLIMISPRPRDQKYLGRNVKNFDKANSADLGWAFLFSSMQECI